MKAALASGSSTSCMCIHTDRGYGIHTGVMSYILRLSKGTCEALQMTSRMAMPDMVFACIACSMGTAAVA